MKDKCDKNCQTCEINQRTYCASQLALANQAQIEELKEMVSKLSFTSNELIIQNREDDEIEDAQSEGA